MHTDVIHASHTDVHITPHLPFPTAGKLFQRNQTFWQWVQKTLAGQGVLMAQVQPTFWPIISLPRQAAPRRWMDLTLGQAGPGWAGCAGGAQRLKAWEEILWK